MWTLSSDGDFLKGKRIWLKPGKRYLFGRVPQGAAEPFHTLQHPSISRRHLVIEVDRVQKGDGVRIHARTKLTFIDQKSKTGTVVNKQSIKGQQIECGDLDTYHIQLGKYEHMLKIEWRPVVLSFSFGSQDMPGKDPVGYAQSRLEDLDVKTVLPYITGKTTYVVQKKRNTAKGLQALINGKHIVDIPYIEQIVYAATSSDLETEESLCPLEQDYDAAWPDPAKYLPPRGKETTQCPDSDYAPPIVNTPDGPVPKLLHVFEGYTFIFFDDARFEDLGSVISNGHGKALLFKVEPEKTTAQELLDYISKASGSKTLAREVGGTSGILLVQPRNKKNSEWYSRFETEVCRLTGQQFVETGDFLDAILRNNASQLYKPYQPPSGPDSAGESESQTIAEVENTGAPKRAEASVRSQDNPRPTKRARTQTYVPKFKNFDDGFDMDSVPAHSLEPDEEEAEEPTKPAADSLPDQSIENQEPSDMDDGISELLPGATAMKRHFSGRERPAPTPPPKPKPKAKKQLLDVRKAVRQHREEEDRAARAREEGAAALIDGMDLSKLQNLAIVEEMAVIERARPERLPDGQGERWDNRWNGRKNFKKFRSKGGDGPQHRIQTLIVPLEEAKRKDFGLGHEYWDETTTTTEQNRHVVQESNDTMEASQPTPSSGRTTTARSRKRPAESQDDTQFRFRRKRH